MELTRKDNPEKYDKVVEYVHKNYKTYYGKNIIIREFNSHFKINICREDAPLVLSLAIAN